MTGGRDHQAAATVGALIDTLVSDHDVGTLAALLLERVVALLDLSSAVLLLTDRYAEEPRGPRGMTVVAASCEHSRRLETFGVELHSGPGVECVTAGGRTGVDDLGAAPGRRRWPRYATAADTAGFRAVHALPMWSRGRSVGALVLLQTVPRRLDDRERRIGQALADATTVALLQRRAVRDAEIVAAALRDALESRVHAAQARGVGRPVPGAGSVDED